MAELTTTMTVAANLWQSLSPLPVHIFYIGIKLWWFRQFHIVPNTLYLFCSAGEVNVLLYEPDSNSFTEKVLKREMTLFICVIRQVIQQMFKAFGINYFHVGTIMRTLPSQCNLEGNPSISDFIN